MFPSPQPKASHLHIQILASRLQCVRMNRSSGVTVIAVFALLGSLLCLAMGCLTGLAFLLGSSTKSVEPAAQPMVKFGLIVGLLFLLIPAIWGISSSIGLFRLQPWARISALIFSGLLIFFGIASPLFLLAIPMPPPPNVNPDVMTGIKIGISGFYLILAAIGTWWMVFLTRPAVKLQFQGGGVPVPPPRRPLSITIIAWLLIVSACFVPINLAMHFPGVLFGVVITGWAANLYLLLFGAAAVAGGIGLLRLEPVGRFVSIGYFVFGILNGLVTWLLPGSAERTAKMFAAMPAYLRTQPPPTFNPLAMAVFTLPLMLVPLYFLVKHKLAFDPPGPMPDPPPMVQGTSS